MRNSKKIGHFRGFSILEFLITTPILITFAIGVLGGARVFQAHNALKAGLDTSLRCLYPVDGKCIEVSSNAPTALYDYYKINSPIGYESDQYDYNGRGSWFDVPTYTYTPFFARILQQGQSIFAQTNYSAKRVSYEVTGEMAYVYQTARLPYIQGSDAKNPSFVYERQRSAGYGSSQDISLSNIDLVSSNPNRRHQTVTFTIPNPWGGAAPRYLFAGTTGKDTRSGPFGTGYAGLAFPANAPTHAEIAIHMRGTGSGAGKNEINLTWGNNDLDLGGRVWATSGEANFVPRGLPRDYVMEEFFDRYTEFELHDSIVVPYDTPITLHFRISETGNGATEWHGNDLRIFTARFGSGYDNFSCGLVSRYQYNQDGGANQGTWCVKPDTNFYTTGWSVNTSVNADPETPRAIGCQLTQSEATTTLGGMVGDLESYDLYANGASCTDYVVTNTCPAYGIKGSGGSANNFGVPQEPDTSGQIRNSSQASAICPVSGDTRTVAAGASFADRYWTEANVRVNEVGSSDPFSYAWTKERCTQSFSLPGRVASVPSNKLTIPSPTSAYSARYTGSQDPHELLVNEPQNYNCSDIHVVDRRYAEEQEPPLPPESLFVGVQHDLGEYCWEETLHHEATNLGLHAAAFFKPDREKEAAYTLPEPPGGSCGISSRLRYLEIGDETKITTSPLPYPQKPAECEATDVVCRSELAGFTGGQSGDPHADYEYAENFGMREIAATYPSAQHCEGMGADAGPDCVDISYTEINDSGKVIHRAIAKANVPLFFGTSVEVSASKDEVAERSYRR